MNTYHISSENDYQQQKDYLSRRTAHFKTAIERSIGDLTQNMSTTGKRVLIGVGVLAAGYIVFRLFSGRNAASEATVTEKGTVVVAAETESPIVMMIKSAIASFLLAIAREKIMAYIEQLTRKDEEPRTEPAVAAKSQRA